MTAEKQMNEMLVQTMKQADSSNKLASHTEVNGTSNGKHYDNAESASAQGDKIMRTSSKFPCSNRFFRPWARVSEITSSVKRDPASQALDVVRGVSECFQFFSGSGRYPLKFGIQNGKTV